MAVLASVRPVMGAQGSTKAADTLSPRRGPRGAATRRGAGGGAAGRQKGEARAPDAQRGAGDRASEFRCDVDHPPPLVEGDTAETTVPPHLSKAIVILHSAIQVCPVRCPRRLLSVA